MTSDWSKSSSKQYPKSKFQYDAQSDTYRCPAEQLLSAGHRYKGNENNRPYVEYKTQACANCEQRDRCTKSRSGRSIKRYESDELREAMREKLKDESTRQRYNQRAGHVEPVFSQLRLKQGLNRFRRKHMDGVRLEFAVHVLAYNLGRLIALKRLLKLLKSVFRAILSVCKTNYWPVPRNFKKIRIFKLSLILPTGRTEKLGV